MKTKYYNKHFSKNIDTLFWIYDESKKQTKKPKDVALHKNEFFH